MAVLDTYEKDPDAVLEYSIGWGAPPWTTTTQYNRRNVVWNPADGLWYDCIVPHVAGATLEDDSDNWEERDEDLWLDGITDEQINSATWNVPTGITKDSDSDDGYVATVWLSGGTPGESYEITCHIQTDNSPPRHDDRTIKVKIKEK